MSVSNSEVLSAPWEADWSAESLAEERINGMVSEVIPSEEVRAGRRFGLQIFDGQDPYSDIGRFVESTVFGEFFNHDLELMKQEYGEYDGASTFLVVLDYENSKPAGVLRMIKPSEAGLKSLKDLASPYARENVPNPWFQPGDTVESRLLEMGNDLEHSIDIATMGIMPEYRSAHAMDGTSASLYSTCVRWCIANNYTNWVAIVDKKIFDDMQSWGEPCLFFDHASFAPYLDSSASLPVRTELYSMLERVGNFSQDIADLYKHGKGLHEQYVLPDFPHEVQ